MNLVRTGFPDEKQWNIRSEEIINIENAVLTTEKEDQIYRARNI